MNLFPPPGTLWFCVNAPGATKWSVWKTRGRALSMVHSRWPLLPAHSLELPWREELEFALVELSCRTCKE